MIMVEKDGTMTLSGQVTEDGAQQAAWSADWEAINEALDMSMSVGDKGSQIIKVEVQASETVWSVQGHLLDPDDSSLIGRVVVDGTDASGILSGIAKIEDEDGVVASMAFDGTAQDDVFYLRGSMQ